ncbi:hypothetical protein [Vibrio parahaemolyticus]|uniref:hypothetical protein n=1 Tax=Vibrio parahaemolyticus TaxID=670 RepID=UPI003CC54E86
MQAQHCQIECIDDAFCLTDLCSEKPTLTVRRRHLALSRAPASRAMMSFVSAHCSLKSEPTLSLKTNQRALIRYSMR